MWTQSPSSSFIFLLFCLANRARAVSILTVVYNVAVLVRHNICLQVPAPVTSGVADIVLLRAVGAQQPELRGRWPVAGVERQVQAAIEAATEKKKRKKAGEPGSTEYTAPPARCHCVCVTPWRVPIGCTCPVTTEGGYLFFLSFF